MGYQSLVSNIESWMRNIVSSTPYIQTWKTMSPRRRRRSCSSTALIPPCWSNAGEAMRTSAISRKRCPHCRRDPGGAHRCGQNVPMFDNIQ